MPLSSKNISRKLGKAGKGTTSVVEHLKLQHAEELAAANEEHALKVKALEKELEQCRAEIETLTELDERSDTITPLPSPSKTLKFVKNVPTGRKARKQGAAGMGGKNVVNLIAGIKMQHRKDLKKAAALYAEKLNMLQKEVQKYREEMEALKASSIRGGGERGCDNTGVSLNTGVAENDKENISQRRCEQKEAVPSKRKTISLSQKRTTTSKVPMLQQKAFGSLDERYLRERYERLFQEEYKMEKDPELEKAMSLVNDVTSESVKDDEIDAMCKDLVSFIADVKAKSLGYCVKQG